MNDGTKVPGRDPATLDEQLYARWFDGLLDARASAEVRERVERDPELRARFEADQAIESSLRRSFAGGDARRPQLALPAPSRSAMPAWRPIATAAGVLALFGASVTLALLPHDQGGGGQDAIAQLPANPPPAETSGTLLASVAAPIRPRVVQYSLGEVFLDALALEFEPQLGCRMRDAWDTTLIDQLSSAPCSQEEGVVVLGEWVDPRIDVANLVMLRRGESPIMLVVPRCDTETELCVAKDSGLYVHRGMRDGRMIFEVSPVPGSSVLACVDAQSVVTQHQF